MSDNIRYYYYGRNNEDVNNGIICCATKLDGDDVLVGFSFCSPKDNFRKDMGRRIALGRLNASPVRIKFTGHSGDDISNFIKMVVENNSFRIYNWPRWVNKVILNYSVNNQKGE